MYFVWNGRCSTANTLYLYANQVVLFMLKGLFPTMAQIFRSAEHWFVICCYRIIQPLILITCSSLFFPFLMTTPAHGQNGIAFILALALSGSVCCHTQNNNERRNPIQLNLNSNLLFTTVHCSIPNALSMCVGLFVASFCWRIKKQI